MALTVNHIACAIVEQVAVDNEGCVVVLKRGEAKISVVKQRKVPILELVVSKEGHKPTKQTIVPAASQYESLGRYFKF